MATSSSMFYDSFYSNKPDVTCIFFKGTVGSNTLTIASPNREIASAAESGTAVYTLTLRTTYHEFLGMDLTFNDTDIDGWWLISEAVATDKTIVFTPHAAGSATNPANDKIIYGRIWLRNSGAKSL